MGLIAEPLAGLPDVRLIRPVVHADFRGEFVQTYQRDQYLTAGIVREFVQDNLSRSRRNVLRGLHFQNPNGQGKLVRVTVGSVWDVAVDLRRGSPSFGKWAGVHLSEKDYLQLYVPAGFAHGFVVTTKEAVFEYRCTAVYTPESEHCLRWDDPDVGIEWQVDQPVLSERDEAGATLEELRVQGALPGFES